MTCFAIWTLDGLGAQIDLVVETKALADKHKRELIRDCGFESSDVVVKEYDSESIAYAVQDLLDGKGSFAGQHKRALALATSAEVAPRVRLSGWGFGGQTV